MTRYPPLNSIFCFFIVFVYKIVQGKRDSNALNAFEIVGHA